MYLVIISFLLDIFIILIVLLLTILIIGYKNYRFFIATSCLSYFLAIFLGLYFLKTLPINIFDFFLINRLSNRVNFWLGCFLAINIIHYGAPILLTFLFLLSFFYNYCFILYMNLFIRLYFFISNYY